MLAAIVGQLNSQKKKLRKTKINIANKMAFL